MKNNNPVKEAVAILGTQAALAKECGVAQPSIYKWLKKGIVPPRKVLLVEKITGISRYRLNPIIYQQDK
ncbi:MAG: Cro/CI family transcriptional regulator [Gammaproteobacteria bacterium]